MTNEIGENVNGKQALWSGCCHLLKGIVYCSGLGLVFGVIIILMIITTITIIIMKMIITNYKTNPKLATITHRKSRDTCIPYLTSMHTVVVYPPSPLPFPPFNVASW